MWEKLNTLISNYLFSVTIEDLLHPEKTGDWEILANCPKLLSTLFEPVYNSVSRILILGSLPSVKSRQDGFYYGHPQNRFWKLLAFLFSSPIPKTIDEKKSFLLKNKIALWDVIHSCEITGSSDASIKNAEPNDLEKIFSSAKIESVFTNGKTADRFYKKYCASKYEVKQICLPSTSPANAAWTFDRLANEWKIITNSYKN
jgi:G:T/U mismatch-specific DNA glycosylase